MYLKSVALMKKFVILSRIFFFLIFFAKNFLCRLEERIYHFHQIWIFSSVHFFLFFFYEIITGILPLQIIYAPRQTLQHTLIQLSQLMSLFL